MAEGYGSPDAADGLLPNRSRPDGVFCLSCPVALFACRVAYCPGPVYTLLLRYSRIMGPAGRVCHGTPSRHVYPINILVVLSACRVRIVRASLPLVL